VGARKKTFAAPAQFIANYALFGRDKFFFRGSCARRRKKLSFLFGAPVRNKKKLSSTYYESISFPCEIILHEYKEEEKRERLFGFYP